MLSSFGWLLCCQLIIPLTVYGHDCNVNLDVNTESGPVRGVALTTYLNHKNYIAYRGIPYAEPPVDQLRYKVPVPIAPWHKTLQANDYGNSCLVIYQSQLFPLNSTQSEDCLYLNIFTPVMESKKFNAKKAVMFFIPGGAFTEGDGTNGFYGPDFIVEEDVVLVTINYRLGPWGFSNFDVKGFTGNMGFKDQQLALEWVKQNIKYFGGDPNSITVFGESAGGIAVHLHMLSDRSRKCMKRAIPMSGSAFPFFAHYQANNHVELYKEIFALDPQATGQDVLRFMQNAPVEIILEKAPVLILDRNTIEFYYSAVIEDAKKAERPFLTRSPRDIYKTTRINVDALFGLTSAEYLVLLNPADRYSWIEPMKNFSNIGLPFSGLTLSPDSSVYREAAKRIYKFYFGTRELLPTVENLNIYIQMCTDMNFVYPTYVLLKVHSGHARTFFYENNLTLNLNAVKIQNGIQDLAGTSHFEDLMYLFLSKKYAKLYDDVLANQHDLTNRKTLKALQFVPKMFTNYAKRGSPGSFISFTRLSNNCVGITNDGLKSMSYPRKETMQFWDSIYDSVRPWIVNPF